MFKKINIHIIFYTIFDELCWKNIKTYLYCNKLNSPIFSVTFHKIFTRLFELLHMNLFHLLKKKQILTNLNHSVASSEIFILYILKSRNHKKSTTSSNAMPCVFIYLSKTQNKFTEKFQ